MSELLFSNYPPAKLTQRSFQDYFGDTVTSASEIRIATGYVSASALAELTRIVEMNNGPKIEMLIGMHYFDGFSRNQFEGARKLGSVLNEKKLGSVYVATVFRFHGKMYSFSHSGKPFSSVIGSSNFSSVIQSSERLYETDLLIEDPIFSGQVDEKIRTLTDRIGRNISEIQVDNFNEYNPLLHNHEGVIKESEAKILSLFSQKSEYSFEVPIKTEKSTRSSLNVFFGKGRVNKRGLILPRPWYEVEIIISKSITQQQGFPTHKKFRVYTDDGWSFDCSSNGDYGKNFRSAENLQILGRWLKGRLEHAGVLNVGDMVTNEVLEKYGRRSFTLRSTDDPNNWLLNFST